jgi:propanol-preferring alcohol dehydrogenase
VLQEQSRGGPGWRRIGGVLAWWVERPGPLAGSPLRFGARPDPEPTARQVRLLVRTCGVCRTDLHLAEGDLPPRAGGVVPGHEVVGVVDALGSCASRFAVGDRVGVAWLRSTCGVCRWCAEGRENLCPAALFTGWDADGGYAERCVVDERFAYALPREFDDEHAAPLLCAGIIGFRALRQAKFPPGGRLAIYGFGGSAHLAAQVAVAEGARVHVITRSREAQLLALELGARSAGETPPDEPVDAALLFAPAGSLVPVALSNLEQGGTLVVAGIYLTQIPPLDYGRHLFRERSVRSVTANTRQDGEEFLAVAARLGLRVATQSYPLDRADQALRDLASGAVRGAAVLRVS